MPHICLFYRQKIVYFVSGAAFALFYIFCLNSANLSSKHLFDHHSSSKISSNRERHLSPSESVRKDVKESFIHAWAGYKQFAWGADELNPVSKKGKYWGKSKGGFGLSLVDSLGTMWLMGLKQEFYESLEWIQENLDFHKDFGISTFETTIRLLGGLISAFELSGEQHTVLLTKAKDLGYRLLWAYNTTLGVPSQTVNLATHSHFNPQWTGDNSILSEFGSIQLELKTLSWHTGDKVFWDKASHVMKLIRKVIPENGLVPIELNNRFGTFSSNLVTLGARGDSFFEYLLKQWILTGKVEDELIDMFKKCAHGIITHLVQRSQPSGQVYIGESNDGQPIYKMDHLACFSGGMFALAAAECPHCEESLSWRQLGIDLGETCHKMYSSTATGLGPEIVEFPNNGPMRPRSVKYILRPEAIETWYYLWKYTKDKKWREYGAQALKAINRFCRIESGGYAGVRNVSSVVVENDDLMQSFFLAETLKYLFLLFSDEDVIDSKSWVFSTEAHPFRIRLHPAWRTF